MTREYKNKNELFTGVIFDPDPIQESEYLKILNNRAELKRLDEARKQMANNFKPKIILRRRNGTSSINSSN